jgi:hypothetical protein
MFPAQAILAFAPPLSILIHHVSTSGMAPPWGSSLSRMFPHSSGIVISITCLRHRILLSLFAMWDFNRLNKKKEARCLAEGITEERSDEFRNMGDASPLFR